MSVVKSAIPAQNDASKATGGTMRRLAVLIGGVTAALALASAACAQDEADPNAAAPPDHVSMTNARIGGSPQFSLASPEPKKSKPDKLVATSKAPKVNGLPKPSRAVAPPSPDPYASYNAIDLAAPADRFVDADGNEAVYLKMPDGRVQVILRAPQAPGR